MTFWIWQIDKRWLKPFSKDFFLILAKCWYFMGFISKIVIFQKKCWYFIGFIRVGENKVAVARERWSPHHARCSHSAFIFANPYKTNEISTFFLKNQIFAYKTNEISTFLSKNHNFAHKTDEISTFSQNQSKNQRENHVFEKGLSHLLSICQIQNVT